LWCYKATALYDQFMSAFLFVGCAPEILLPEHEKQDREAMEFL
jgi:hypothetical protein